jgi:hypothetical protein
MDCGLLKTLNVSRVTWCANRLMASRSLGLVKCSLVTDTVLACLESRGSESGCTARLETEESHRSTTWINDVVYRVLWHLRAKMTVVRVDRLALYLEGYSGWASLRREECGISQRLNGLWALIARVTLLHTAKVSRVTWRASRPIARRGLPCCVRRVADCI